MTPCVPQSGQDLDWGSCSISGVILETLDALVVVLDLEGRIVFFNEACSRTTGYRFEEVEGRPALELLVAAKERRAVREAFRELCASGRPQRHESCWRTKDGQERFIAWSSCAVRGEDGKVGYIVETGIDVTEHRAAEDDLRRSEERYRRLVETANDAIMVAEADSGLIIEANQRAETLLGRPMAEIIGMHQSALHPPGLGEEYRERFQAAVESGTDVDSDLAIYRPDGSTVTVEVSTSVYELNGKRMIQGIFRDISERLEAEAHIRETNERLRRSLLGTIGSLASAVEKRDPYTAGHECRVSELSVALGAGLGLSEDEIEGLRIGSLVHDVGKIYVPSEILTRPGRLSIPEFELVKMHPQVGFEILRQIEFPWPIRDMVLQHHERSDGSGYPNGLIGDEISPAARIVAVADTVEAMASHRPYRPSRGIDAALVELLTNRTILYDSRVVDCCVDLFRSHRFAWSGSPEQSIFADTSTQVA